MRPVTSGIRVMRVGFGASETRDGSQRTARRTSTVDQPEGPRTARKKEPTLTLSEKGAHAWRRLPPVEGFEPDLPHCKPATTSAEVSSSIAPVEVERWIDSRPVASSAARARRHAREAHARMCSLLWSASSLLWSASSSLATSTIRERACASKFALCSITN